jgi:hypothetical protein
MPYIGRQAEENAVDLRDVKLVQGTDTSTGATSFTVAHVGTDILRVYLNGALKVEGISNDYTVTTTAVVFGSAPSDGDVIRIDVFERTALNVVDTVLASVGGTFSGNVVVGATSANQTLDVASHDLVDGGLKLAGTLVTASAAEVNLLDGVAGLVQADLTKLAAIDSSAAELNLLDGVSGLVKADLTKLAAIDASATTLNAAATTGKSIAMAIVFGG